jgi:hypothetical protein
MRARAHTYTRARARVCAVLQSMGRLPDCTARIPLTCTARGLQVKGDSEEIQRNSAPFRLVTGAGVSNARSHLVNPNNKVRQVAAPPVTWALGHSALCSLSAAG